MNLASRLSGVHHGWWVLTSVCGMTFIADAFFFRGFALLFVPVRDSLHLTNVQTSLVFAAARASTGLVGLTAGLLIDRFGTRRLAVAGVVLAASGYFAFFFVDSFLWFALVYLGMISIGNNVTFSHAIVAGLSMWFRRRIAFSLSMQDASASLGSLALIPVINILILDVGWEWTVLIMGFTLAFVVLPLSLLIRDSPESMGLLPDGERPEEGQPAPSSTGGMQQGASIRVVDHRDFGVSEAMHTRSLWLLLLGLSLWRATTVGILVNLQPILIEWKGVGAKEVGYLFSFMMGINIVIRVTLGLAADRWPKQIILTVSSAAMSLGLLVLILGSWGSTPWMIFLYLILAGVGDGVGVVSWATLADFFGRRRFATLRGLMTFSNSWALFAAPVFVGWWADRTGCGSSIESVAEGCSYSFPIWVGVSVLGVAALSFAMLRRPKRRLATTP